MVSACYSPQQISKDGHIRGHSNDLVNNADQDCPILGRIEGSASSHIS